MPQRGAMPAKCVEPHDPILGCIVGGAIGDAYGGPYEGVPSPVQLQRDAPWRLSDDTQLTLATCEAIAASGAVDPERIAGVFGSWFKQRRITGIGAGTFKALSELMHGGHWGSSAPRANPPPAMGRRCGRPRLRSVLIPRMKNRVRRFVTSRGLPTITKRPTSARLPSPAPCVQRLCVLGRRKAGSFPPLSAASLTV